MAKKFQITQYRGANGSSRTQRETLRSLGLGRIGSTTEHSDSPQLRGMIRAVDHLVRVKTPGGGEDIS
ncbi:MAG: 50S ribosomal protein L30 [Solirubrobacterales bacterium]